MSSTTLKPATAAFAAAIQTAHSFFHQKLRVYEFSSSERQRDDIEYSIAEYVYLMPPELYSVISDGDATFLKEHSRFECDLRIALARLETVAASRGLG